MDDLFSASPLPDADGFEALPHLVPVFFAIYPSTEDLPRVVAWRQRVCKRAGPSAVALRPAELLHVSVALCGTPRRQRQPLREALRVAAEQFAYPSCMDSSCN